MGKVRNTSKLPLLWLGGACYMRSVDFSLSPVVVGAVSHESRRVEGGVSPDQRDSADDGPRRRSAKFALRDLEVVLQGSERSSCKRTRPDLVVLLW